MRSISSPFRAAFLALALLAPAAWHAPLDAEEPAATQPTLDPYVDLYAAMDAVTGTDQEFNRHYRFALRELRQLPHFQAMERSDPGIFNAIAAAMKPWIKKQADRMEARSRPRVFDLMKAQLTPEDASKLAAYCRTERGRKFLLKQFDPERLYADPPGQSSRPRQPLGQPTAFLKPASGYVPATAKPVAPPNPVAAVPPEPAVAAILDNPELQARVSSYFAAYEDLILDLSAVQQDKDLQDGMMRDIDYAASTYGWRLFDKPLR